MRGSFLFTHKTWLFLALLLPWFFVGGPGYESSRSIEEAWNVGHVVFFAVFTLAVDRHFHLCRRLSGLRIGFFLLIIVGLAASIEFLQTLMPGRVSSRQDILLGVAGGVIVLLWQFSGQLRAGGKTALRGCGVCIIIICLLPLLLNGYDEYRAWRDFPVLADFESALELSRWGDKDNILRVQAPVKNGRFALKVSLTTDKYSGIGLRYFPENWHGARALTFKVFNPGEMVALHYRVHDWKHRGKDQDYANRFNGQANLSSGWNTITVPMEEIVNGPKERRMDLAHIRGLGFFVIELPSERALYYDDIRLLW